MAQRDAATQSLHDRGVRLEAEELDSDDWNVRADLDSPKYDTPPKIGDRIPDIYATKKGGHTRIVEIETDPEDDSDQLSTFRRSAAQQGHKTKFYWRVMNKRGRGRKRQ